MCIVFVVEESLIIFEPATFVVIWARCWRVVADTRSWWMTL